MKRLSIILLYSLFLFAIARTIYIINFHELKSKYTIDIKEITGVIEEIKHYDNSIKFIVNGKEKVLINSYDKDIKIKLGYKVKLNGIFKTPSNNTVFNLFSYKNYLFSKKINYVFDMNTIEVLEEDNYLYKIKNEVKDKIDSYTNPYIPLLIFGSNNLDETSNEIYRVNGINHLFSVSGMHIIIIASILLFLLSKISRFHKVNYIIVFLILLLYGFLVSFSASVVRSILMFSGLNISKLLNKRIKAIHLLSLICILLLLINPFYIYDLGFLYSFIIGFALIKFSNLINGFKNYFSKLFITSCIAFIVALPITINTNFSVNFLSPILNMIFVPLVTLILFPLSLISLVIPKIEGILTIFTNILEYISIKGYNMRLELIFSHISVIGMIIYYVSIYFFLRKANMIRLVVLLLIVMFHYNLNFFRYNPSLTMIDVGQGDSHLIQLENNKGNILIDTGGNEKYDLSKYVLIPYLKSRGIKKLNYLVISHGDFDHIGNALKLVDNFKIENIILNSYEDSKLEKELIKISKKKKIKVYRFNKNILNINGTKFYFLNKISNEENSDSLVIYTKLNGYKLLFMGDSGFDEEKEIIDVYNLENMDILKIGHHGSKYSTSDEFVDYLKPKIALISVAKKNWYGHPSKRVVDLMNKNKVKTFMTSVDGSVLFEFARQLNIKTSSSAR